MNFLEVDVDGKKVTVQFSKVGNKIWYHLLGETFVVQDKAVRASVRKGGKESGGNQIRSPMPGKITKILVEPLGLVEQKQTLIVLEAMKMEYNLKAGANGKIKAIHCKVGDQVEQDKLLLEIEST